jgi:UDP-N-acetylglucosamine 2-epimerase (non-hydrolysing)
MSSSIQASNEVAQSGRQRESLASIPAPKAAKKVLIIFGTRPEVIKLAPVIRQLERFTDCFATVNVASSQHTDLLHPLVRLFGVRIDHDLHVMEPNQTPNLVCGRVLLSLDAVITTERPDLILLQGDTTTALAAALAGFHRQIPIAHVEAGLRSGNSQSPYPEEMNRRLISRLATYHFAATTANRETLISEGVPKETVFVTGNPVVDALQSVLQHHTISPQVQRLLDATAEMKRIVLTTHRREAFGEKLLQNLCALRSFVEDRKDVALLFPVHPNPQVMQPAFGVLGGHPRIHLFEPLEYPDFIELLSHSWLIVSDSGGVQEEAPTLGKPLLVLRENTERNEALRSGVARLVGGSSEKLTALLEEVYCDGSWIDQVKTMKNPFGQGDSARQIVEKLALVLGLTLSPSLSSNPSTPTLGPTPAEQGAFKIPITVVVPCFNEEAALPQLRSMLNSMVESLSDRYRIDLLFVDDGSNDNTWKLLQEYFGSMANCTLLRQKLNLGIAASILEGIRHAKTEVVCSIDCDCTYDPRDLANLIPRLSADVDMVTGSPYHTRGKVLHVPAWRLSFSKVASLLYRCVLRQKLATYTSCFRVYRRSAVMNLQLREGGYPGIAEMLGRLDLQRSRIVECPTTLSTRMLGYSKLKIANTILGHLRVLTRLLGVRILNAAKRRRSPASIHVHSVISTEVNQNT